MPHSDDGTRIDPFVSEPSASGTSPPPTAAPEPPEEPPVMQLGLQNTYSALPSRFYARVAPAPVKDPRLVVYNSRLAYELDFDPALARRLASEVEDHLRDAAEADPAWPSPEAERRAVERFGLGREIAAQFAVDAVDRQARRTWIAFAVTVVATFMAMRLRVIWLDDDVLALAPLIDRYAFIAALAVGRRRPASADCGPISRSPPQCRLG